MCCGCQSSVVEGLAQQHALIGLAIPLILSVVMI